MSRCGKDTSGADPPNPFFQPQNATAWPACHFLRGRPAVSDSSSQNVARASHSIDFESSISCITLTHTHALLTLTLAHSLTLSLPAELASPDGYQRRSPPKWLDTSHGVRRAAVTSLAFLLFKNPRQVHRFVQLCSARCVYHAWYDPVATVRCFVPSLASTRASYATTISDKHEGPMACFGATLQVGQSFIGAGGWNVSTSRYSLCHLLLPSPTPLMP